MPASWSPYIHHNAHIQQQCWLVCACTIWACISRGIVQYVQYGLVPAVLVVPTGGSSIFGIFAALSTLHVVCLNAALLDTSNDVFAQAAFYQAHA